MRQFLNDHPLSAEDASNALADPHAQMEPCLIRVLLENGADASVFHIRHVPKSERASELLNLHVKYKYAGENCLQTFTLLRIVSRSELVSSDGAVIAVAIYTSRATSVLVVFRALFMQRCFDLVRWLVIELGLVDVVVGESARI